MYVFKIIVVLMLVLCFATEAQRIENNIAEASVSGFALEMILTKLDHLQDKVVALESAMKQIDLKLPGEISKLSDDMGKLNQRIDEKFSETFNKLAILQTESKQEREIFNLKLSDTINDQNRTTVEILSTQQAHLTTVKEFIEQKLNVVMNQLSHNLSDLQSQSKIIEPIAKHEPTGEEIQKLAPTKDLISIPSCKKTPSNRSGKYKIQPTESDGPFWAYCEQAVFGGGWLIFQHRYDGSVDFLRNWTDYRNGFGNVDKEFWLGLEHLHRLTSVRPHELLIEMKDFDGHYSHARYDTFKIGSETERYELKELGNYTGTSYDGLRHHVGRKFSTVDRDNDIDPNLNCAFFYNGAWWFSNCVLTHLNGPYANNKDQRSMFWRAFKPLAYTRMMIREK